MLRIVFISRDSDVESIGADVDCDFRDYCDHLQSDFLIPRDAGYGGYRQHSDCRTGCGFYLCLEVRAIAVITVNWKSVEIIRVLWGNMVSSGDSTAMIEDIGGFRWEILIEPLTAIGAMLKRNGPVASIARNILFFTLSVIMVARFSSTNWAIHGSFTSAKNTVNTSGTVEVAGYLQRIFSDFKWTPIKDTCFNSKG